MDRLNKTRNLKSFEFYYKTSTIPVMVLIACIKECLEAKLLKRSAKKTIHKLAHNSIHIIKDGLPNAVTGEEPTEEIDRINSDVMKITYLIALSLGLVIVDWENHEFRYFTGTEVQAIESPVTRDAIFEALDLVDIAEVKRILAIFSGKTETPSCKVDLGKYIRLGLKDDPWTITLSDELHVERIFPISSGDLFRALDTGDGISEYPRAIFYKELDQLLIDIEQKIHLSKEKWRKDTIIVEAQNIATEKTTSDTARQANQIIIETKCSELFIETLFALIQMFIDISRFESEENKVYLLRIRCQIIEMVNSELFTEFISICKKSKNGFITPKFLSNSMLPALLNLKKLLVKQVYWSSVQTKIDEFLNIYKSFIYVSHLGSILQIDAGGSVAKTVDFSKYYIQLDHGFRSEENLHAGGFYSRPYMLFRRAVKPILVEKGYAELLEKHGNALISQLFYVYTHLAKDEPGEDTNVSNYKLDSKLVQSIIFKVIKQSGTDNFQMLMEDAEDDLNIISICENSWRIRRNIDIASMEIVRNGVISQETRERLEHNLLQLYQLRYYDQKLGLAKMDRTVFYKRFIVKYKDVIDDGTFFSPDSVSYFLNDIPTILILLGKNNSAIDYITAAEHVDLNRADDKRTSKKDEEGENPIKTLVGSGFINKGIFNEYLVFALIAEGRLEEVKNYMSQFNYPNIYNNVIEEGLLIVAGATPDTIDSIIANSLHKIAAYYIETAKMSFEVTDGVYHDHTTEFNELLCWLKNYLKMFFMVDLALNISQSKFENGSNQQQVSQGDLLKVLVMKDYIQDSYDQAFCDQPNTDIN